MDHRKISLNILGLVRNGGLPLKETLDEIGALRRQLHHSFCIIATNDNSDDTDRLLADFADQDANCTILRMNGLIRAQPQRVERIAVVRNIVLAAMWDKSVLPHTLVLDLDGPNTSLPIERILAALATAQEHDWDALFANQLPGYYDIYALRHTSWCPVDPWQEIRRKRRGSFRLRSKDQLVAQLIHDRQYAIPPTHPHISVLSAFGGLGLYRTDALQEAWYGARNDTGEIVCEHVILHQAMVANGKRLFIDPALINEAPKEHLGATSGRPFPGFD